MLKEWLESYHAEELFDENGRLIPELKALTPEGTHRLGANPHANGGLLLREFRRDALPLAPFLAFGVCAALLCRYFPVQRFLGEVYF